MLTEHDAFISIDLFQSTSIIVMFLFLSWFINGSSEQWFLLNVSHKKGKAQNNSQLEGQLVTAGHFA